MTDVMPPIGECAIVSHNSMTGLELLAPDLPDGTALPPVMQYLFACYVRFHDDPDFVADQLRWFAEHA